MPRCRGPGNIGRVAVEGLGAAAWHLGMPAPEQARHLLLAVTRISNMVRRAQCSAMITIPAGESPGEVTPLHLQRNIWKMSRSAQGSLTHVFDLPGRLLPLQHPCRLGSQAYSKKADSDWQWQASWRHQQ